MLERGAGFKLSIPAFDLLARERAETVDSEFLAAEAAHHRAVDDGALQLVEGKIAVRRGDAASGEVADEAARETVAGACGVEHVLQEVAGGHEVAAAAEQDRAVLAALDDERVRPHFENLGGGAADVVLAGEEARLAIVDQQEVPLLQGLEKLRAEIVDPI